MVELPYKKTLIIIFVIIVAVLLLFIFLDKNEPIIYEEVIVEEQEIIAPNVVSSIIGTSVEGRYLNAYTYGSGDTELLFVGGMHGGYEWNSVLLAKKFKQYLDENIENIPKNLTITVIPSINPDGIFKVVKKEGEFVASDIAGDTSLGRFNGNGIDLNRNFDCKWKPESTWRGNVVSAGYSAFSEPEATALQTFVLENNPNAVIFWHSQGSAVYASECEDGVLPETLTIMNTYANAAISSY